MSTCQAPAPEVATDSLSQTHDAAKAFARPAAPALDLRAPKSAEVPSPSSPGPARPQLSLRALGDCLDPMLAPDPEPSEPRLDAASASEPDDDCPPTVRTPRNATGLVGDPITVSPGVDAPVPAVDSVDSALPAEPAPGSLRVSDLEAGFFRFDSFPPVVEDLDSAESEPSEPPLSPELLARRSGLRKLVGAAVAGVAALAVVAVAIGAFGGGTDPVALKAAPVEGPSEVVGHGVASPRFDGALAAAPAKPAARSAADQASIASTGAAPVEDPSDLRAEAVQLLQSRKLAEAAQVARTLIAAEPDHAFGYRCLGAALQDQGKWSEALEIYGSCAKHAQRGEVGECVALGGRR